MSQELQVVLCYSCDTYQTQIVKKSTKWICKICNEKQSLKKVFGQGSGKDCRKHCQMLNDLKAKQTANDKNFTILALETEGNYIQPSPEKEKQNMASGSSKWAKYLSQPSNSDSENGEFEEEIRPSQFFLPKCTPESFDIPQAKKFKNDFGHSLEFNNDRLLNSKEDNCFDIDFVENKKNTTPLSVFNKNGQLSPERSKKSTEKISNRKNCELNTTKINFDLFAGDLIEEKISGDTGICNIAKDCISESTSKPKGSCDLFANEIQKSNACNKILQTKSNEKAIFRMVPSKNFLMEDLQRQISLLEDINNYTVEQLTEMCRF